MSKQKEKEKEIKEVVMKDAAPPVQEEQKIIDPHTSLMMGF